jgi:hypothetical protein
MMRSNYVLTRESNITRLRGSIGLHRPKHVASDRGELPHMTGEPTLIFDTSGVKTDWWTRWTIPILGLIAGLESGFHVRLMFTSVSERYLSKLAHLRALQNQKVRQDSDWCDFIPRFEPRSSMVQMHS